MLALVIGSEEITSSLFGYGSFDVISVKNSADALFYFALGLPAFSIIKIFSAFLFARHNTKIPFYFSLVSVILNILISIIFFKEIGFIIIPIATSISSWVNVFLLLIYLNFYNYFNLGTDNLFSILKIICSSFLSSYFFLVLINKFDQYLDYDSSYKLLSIIIMVILTFILYIFVSILTKAFKFSDFKLKY